MNKKEILYNSKSLVETWMTGNSKVSALKLIFEGKDSHQIIPCGSIEEAGEKLGDMLFSNNGNYTLCKLCGDGNKEFGKLDIV